MGTTNVLAEVIAQGLDDVAFCGIYDPDAVKVMQDAGVGNEASLLLGGKLTMPALQRQSHPLNLSGRV